MKPSADSLSIILPIRNEAAHIEDTLRQLLDQTLDPARYEILVVDGESDDGTQAIVERIRSQHPERRIRLLNNPLRLSSGARNVGARAAEGDFVLVVDGHVQIPSRSLLEDSLEQAALNEALCLGRPQPLNPDDNDAFQRLVCHARQSPLAHSTESFIFENESRWVSPISVAVMYHRSLFETVGYFDESFDAAEDLEFNYRLEKHGVRCLLSPLFEVRYYPRRSYRALFLQVRRYGMGRARFVRKHPERFRLELLVPSAVVLFWLSGAPLLLLGGALAQLWLLGAAVYVGALVADTLRRHRPELGAGALLQVPLLIATVHLGMGAGFILGMLERFRS